MNSSQTDVAAIARRHGLSEAAGRALFDALVAGGGHQAQFSHAELGGMGQWSGGMTQIGDMFNDALRGKVAGFCQEVAAAAAEALPDQTPAGRATSPWASRGADRWWPATLGEPASAGGQNGVSYAFFPDKKRLAITQGGSVKLYDTGEHRLSGFAQQQPGRGALSFSGQHGPVALDSLRVVDS